MLSRGYHDLSAISKILPLAAILRIYWWAGRGGSKETDYCNNPSRSYNGLDQGGNGGGGGN